MTTTPSTTAASTEELRVVPEQLRKMIDDGAELALIDVREEGVFSRGHLFRAVCIALSSLELKIERLVPRVSTRIVLCDDDEGLAGRAARVLQQFGYTSIAVLAGGVAAWKAAGYELFTGINVPSKAFGEFIEHRDGTPSISPEELKRRVDAGTKLVILDSRPMAEYTAMNIPGALDCPGAELAYRVHEVVPDPSTLVVVNCAGRTRSIIGAQSLINAGIANEVIALRNGTMGWHLAGFELERGNTRMAPAPGADALAKARTAAAGVAKRFNVAFIGEAELEQMRAEANRRTLYCLDVRDPEEFKRGTLPGFVSAPGGQLVQATDYFMATRHARAVLADTDGVRAIMTASWLNQMGLGEVYVLRGIDAKEFSAHTEGDRVPGRFRAPEMISPHELRDRMSAQPASVAVIDVGTSLQFRKAHVPGARWTIRSRLPVSLAQVESVPAYVFTSSDGQLAQLAAMDASAIRPGKMMALAGGTAAWNALGLPTENGEQGMLDTPEDVWYRPYDKKEGVENSMRDYLTWEVELVEQIKREGVSYPTSART